MTDLKRDMIIGVVIALNAANVVFQLIAIFNR
jgi:hypothetical protein